MLNYLMTTSELFSHMGRYLKYMVHITCVVTLIVFESDRSKPEAYITLADLLIKLCFRGHAVQNTFRTCHQRKFLKSRLSIFTDHNSRIDRVSFFTASLIKAQE